MKKMHILWVAVVFLSVVGLCSAAVPSSPEGSTLTEHVQSTFLWQLVILFVILRQVIKLCRRIQVEDFVLEIAVGVLVGPTVLGRFAPGVHEWLFPNSEVQKALLEFFGMLGVVFLLFQGGTEVRPKDAVKHGKAATWLGIGGVVLPLIAGYLLSLGFCKLTNFSAPGGQSVHLVALFLGNTMAISAMVIIVRLFTALKITRSEVGQIILCGYAINDIVAWMIYGGIFQFASGGGQSVLRTVFLLTLGAVLTGFCLRFAPDMVNRQLEKLAQRKGKGSVYVFVMSLVLGLGLITELLGLTRYFGVFLAGVVVSTSDVVTHEVKERLTTFGRYVMAPIFFVVIGMSLDLGRHFSLATVLFITVSSLVLKYSGAIACARFAGRPKKEWHLIGVSFIPGDVNGIILGGLALSYGLITQDILSAIIISAIVSSIIAGPALRRTVKRMNEARPARTLLDCIPAILRDLPRCDAENRANALEKHILPKIASHTDLQASEIRKKIEFMREKFGMEVRSQEFDLPRGIAHIHVPLPVEEDVLLCFWSGRNIEWGGEAVRFVIVSVTPAEESVSTLSDRVFALMARLDASDLLNLDGTNQSHQQFRTELLKLLEK